MPYEKQNWVNLPSKTTPISAERLNHLETQYDEALAYVNSELSTDKMETRLQAFGTEFTRSQLPSGSDLNTLRERAHAGTWQLVSTGTYLNVPEPILAATVLSVEVANSNNAVTQSLTMQRDGAPRTLTRKLINPSGDNGNPLWTRWVATAMSENTGASPSQQILDLAVRDGWTGVYDPTDPRTTTIADGLVTRIGDGLGNLADLTASAANAPEFLPHEYGGLAGVRLTGGKRMSASFGSVVEDPLCIVVLGRWEGEPVSSGYGVLFDGTAAGRKNIIVRAAVKKMPWGFADGSGDEFGADHSPHTVVLTAHGDHEELTVDGQFAGFRSSASAGLGGITLGATPAGGYGWTGTAGLILVRQGLPTAKQLDRMHTLVNSLTGKTKGAHILRPTTTAFSVTESGREVFHHGDADMVWPVGIQSITKLMTWLTARTVLTDADMTNLTEPYEAGDDSGGNVFSPGDTMRLIDWAWAAIGPSFNAPNEVVARVAGRKMLNGAPGDPKEATRKEMNRLSKLWFGSEAFTNFSYGATLSARQTVDLMRRAFQDPILADLMSTARKTVSMTGPNPRNYTWGHTIPSNSPIPLPEWIGGKTGGGQGDGHVVTAWRNPLDGEVHYTAIMNTPTRETDHRYIELKKVMVATSGSGVNVPLTPSTQPKIGDGLQQTGSLDLTAAFGAQQAGGSASKVLLERQGDWVTLAFQGVSLPADFTGSNVLPLQFRPYTFVYGTLMGDTSTPREVRVNSSGTVNVYGNGQDEALRGTMHWRTRREWPIELPS